MFFQQRPAENATLSYFFGCAGLAKAVAVDVVAGDEDWFMAEAEKAGVRIAHVIDTHVHADHYSGGPELARRAGAPYYLHESNQGRVLFEFAPLTDGQRLEAGNVVVDVLHTPGHTPDSICLLVRDLRRGDEPWFVITGDTLFVGAVGRPDLAGREREMAGQLHDTLHAKLLTLPADLEIYPGHQAGSACGAGLSGKPASTLGFEKRFNPMLAMSREDFVDALTADIPPQPQDMARIVAVNLRGTAPEPAHA
ncbi:MULTISPECIES: MBL fold metallo-hydrolase [unclassified Polaromonas]|jgi:glyoxylase-like metal-dependent hydrolase (beta-lactamase superfamily II)|uniref:MBL fold metallo-hydrolase n=1 Tax=unclassified Polaromonas TaxID=2638319 RepID=UPI000BC5A223|nr:MULTISPECIES: MBL fold metallo-hydrolase [unclassified Polaromonas]OYY35303.1 MAG: MBL fold metallo-hydrolase [Polaromonas sp. 35-63-35]OYZ19091.1 MAG: MBL fold metallo-hydrolase [Polaromonas sp. 16-63-31]OYZ78190.1 MAG: MBL fold metallo-hydrolase [Polaromonas sp. 24-63-21]OZA48748.1 MAG: MBL fold metallo-hydrolase [Polaromonas sp. 17-63-33]OZA87635.1 MAG: MBL fold metallo-hydrolase [Polaromonas sp. 39-63-25]